MELWVGCPPQSPACDAALSAARFALGEEPTAQACGSGARMHLILLALGLALCMAGLVLIGFGIPGNAGPGSGLIVAGMTALVGGLILVGLASAIRQLRHIGQLLEARPMPQALGPDPVGATPPTAGVATPPLTPEAKPAGPVPEVAAQTDVDRMRAAEARVSAPEAIGAKPAPGIATGH